MNRNRIGCLSQTAILSSIITSGLILIFIYFSGGKYFSPGNLNAIDGKVIGGITSHAKIGNDCSRCHTAPWDKGTMNGLCTNCHVEIAEQLINSDSAHSMMIGKVKKQCRDCHGEHLGAQSSLINTSSANFPHNSTRYSLASHKNKADGSVFGCKDCHLNNVTNFEVSVCSDCHLLIDSGFLTKHKVDYGSNCLGCHDGVESIKKKIDHTHFKFKADGKHIDIACADCHKNAKTRLDLQALDVQCAACHIKDDRHSGKFGKECGSCHSATGWKPATFDHNLSNFKLTGSHINTACEKCHLNNIFKGTKTECSNCHAEPSFHAGLFAGSACSNCHNTTRWSPAKFALPHPEPSTGGEGGSGINHGGAGCRQCHTVNLMSASCTACHDSNNPNGG